MFSISFSLVGGEEQSEKECVLVLEKYPFHDPFI